ncbi:thioredoxin family protein [Photobacterium andalusiense]|uniref:Thiol:disulfide interchange protein DsbD n=1 Tax=Photobacterium andalusiense TaxID=2204296 RepID=A0A1Y6MM39_9GAMM|nr:thioredoxin family protein [Photobacterium andalusiense]SMY37616.1 Thiol:disulfide interchange protein DsbD precursor [Photobacterium andalusiense]
MIRINKKLSFIIIFTALIMIVSGYFLFAKKTPAALIFTPINSISELQHALRIAAKQQRPVILDVYAAWCSPCVALSQQTFPEGKVILQLNNFTRLKANVTANSAADIALMQHLNVIGLPSLLFWDPQGHPLPQAKISGFINADNFSDHLQQPMFSITPSSTSQTNAK